jgi:fermentation-respiration switch protein FrsA (DUF1100 family)
VTPRRRHGLRLALAGVVLVAAAAPAAAQTNASIQLRGREQTLRLYGRRGGLPVVVSSGDGGWLHLAPQVAEMLAGRGCFIVGFDVKAYLESFTSRGPGLRPSDEPGDYLALADFAARGATRKPVLVGVSEGAGLSVLAATDPRTRGAIAGVIALGLPDINELGWRWRDALIYLTHGVPNEPTFSTASVIGAMAPTPLVAIHSTRDEFVELEEVRRVLSHARGPTQLYVVRADNHRFSDNLQDLQARLVDAFAWIDQHAPAVGR